MRRGSERVGHRRRRREQTRQQTPTTAVTDASTRDVRFPRLVLACLDIDALSMPAELGRVQYHRGLPALLDHVADKIWKSIILDTAPVLLNRFLVMPCLCITRKYFYRSVSHGFMYAVQDRIFCLSKDAQPFTATSTAGRVVTLIETGQQPALGTRSWGTPVRTSVIVIPQC